MKEKLRKFYAIAIALAVIAPSASAYDFAENGVFYNILDEVSATCEVTYEYPTGNTYSGEVIIPETVTHADKTYRVTAIGEQAFNNSFSLTNLTIPSSITEVGNKAFYSCAYLTNFDFKEGLTYIGDEAFYACNMMAEINIPSTVSTIGINAFAYCQSVSAIGVSSSNSDFATDGVALYDKQMTNLICCPAGLMSTFTFPSSVCSYEPGAFMGATMLPAFNVESGNTVFSAEDGVLYNSDKTTLLLAPAGIISAVNIADGCTSIADGAFRSCFKLPAITFSETVALIGAEAFANCAALTDIVVPGNVKTIENSAFSGCYALTSAIFEEGVESLGDNLFYYSMSLASVKLPSTLSSIGQFAFAYCPLTDITNASLIPQPIGADTFTDYTGTLHVSMNALEAYKTAEYWKNFSNIVGDMLDSGIAEMGCPQNVSVNGYYDVCGRKLSEPVKGLNIVVMSDGSYRKVLIK